MSMKGIGLAAGALVLAFGIGWTFGASGRADIEMARGAADMRAEVLGARASILDARLSLLAHNFGDARQHFRRAREGAQRMQTRLRETGEAERAGRMAIVLAHINDADRMAGAMDPGAQVAAAEAVSALDAARPPGTAP
jgi:hypothetical protein